MTSVLNMKRIKIAILLSVSLLLQACLGTIVGQTVDVAIEVVKVPFKVGAAVIDVVSGDDDDEKSNKKKSQEPDDDD
jgi:hypothetical protein